MFGLIVLGGAAALCLVVWWRIHARNESTLAEMEMHEQEFADEPDAFRWEDHVEDADAWKGDDDDANDADDDGDDIIGVH